MKFIIESDERGDFVSPELYVYSKNRDFNEWLSHYNKILVYSDKFCKGKVYSNENYQNSEIVYGTYQDINARCAELGKEIGCRTSFSLIGVALPYPKKIWKIK